MGMGEREPEKASSLAASASQRVQAILAAAEASAAEIRREALEEAEEIRVRAHTGAGRASESREAMLRRLEALHGELGALISSLREEEMLALAPAGELAPAAEPAPADLAPAAEIDLAGVRLIALDMALDGAPREQTARFLAENFALADPEQLIDEVYASAGR
jgi:hypothetical protein